MASPPGTQIHLWPLAPILENFNFENYRDNYGHKILTGIFFSSIGDAILDFPGGFLYGACSFLVAHVRNLQNSVE